MKKTLLIYLLITVVFLAFRLVGQGTDLANSDSIRWHRRSEKFLTAIKQGDYKSTYQHYQPGVVLMWLNAPVKQASFWYQLQQTEEPKTLENADYFPIIHGYSKNLLVIVLAALLIYQMWAVSRLFSESASYIYGLLMALEPYLIGIDRWFHLTSLETYFGMASFLTLLLWSKSKEENNRPLKYLIISAAFFALAILSKLTSLILGPVLLIILISELQRTKDYKSFAKEALIFTVAFIAACFVLWPALWTDLSFVLNKLYSAVTNAVESDMRGDQITGITALLYYPIILTFKLSPITLVLGIIALLKVNKLLEKKYVKFILIYLATFFIALTVADKKIDRYVVSLIVPLILYISIYVADFSKTLQYIIVSLAFACVLLTSYIHYPQYSAYHSPIYGQKSISRALEFGIYDNSGEYYAQAAEYLNEKGRETYTAVPHNYDSFALYYKGNLQMDIDENTNYIVSSVNHLSEISAMCTSFDKSFGTRFESVVYVFRCK